MKEINSLIAGNLKVIRENRHLSLNDLSNLTGVSKSMLSQIEKGEANPSVGTIWKIADGLKISFTSLINEERDQMKIVRKKDSYEVAQEDGKYRLFTYFPYDPMRKFEIYVIELDCDSEHKSDAHFKGVEEYVVVTKGKLEVQMGNLINVLETDDAAIFVPDKPHTYRNISEDQTKAVIVLYYSE